MNNPMQARSGASRHLLHAAWLLLVISLVPATAAAREDLPLVPYRAVYDAAMGNLSGEAVEQLRVVEPGLYEVSQEMDSLVVTINESSRFRVHKRILRPQSYHYVLSALFNKREQREVFDWNKGTVTHSYKDKLKTEPVKPGTHDRFTSRLQLREDLEAGLESMTYLVAEKGRIKTYEFAALGREAVTTPVGTFSALKVERVRDKGSKRKTHLWLAPEWDYLLVRLKQVEKDGSEFTLQLREAVSGGRPVKGMAQ